MVSAGSDRKCRRIDWSCLNLAGKVADSTDLGSFRLGFKRGSELGFGSSDGSGGVLFLSVEEEVAGKKGGRGWRVRELRFRADLDSGWMRFFFEERDEARSRGMEENRGR